ncbi:protein RDM16 isoform X2 [Aristolochia californica]
MQKELLKKNPLLNKSSTSGSEEINKEVPKAPLSLPSTTSTIPVGAATSMKPPTNTFISAALSIPNIEAVKRAQELAARMGFHQDPEFGPLINLFPGQSAPEVAVQQKPAKAPVLRLDALGREIDEQGNVINVPKPTSTLKVNINKQKKEAFQILRPDLDVSLQSNPHFDDRMGINKTKLLRPKRMNFQFVEEGKWSKQAEVIRFKSQFGEAQAKELKTKQAQLAKAKAELADLNPNLIEVSERVITKEKPKDTIPEVEWWDLALVNSAAYPDAMEGSVEDKLKMDKITVYVEHPLPIEPPAEPAPPPPQPLKLTKKEQKKLRTQRRLAKEKDRQEMIRQGLLEPPKPKVKMSNLMKVLGAEATQDPTRMEMEVRSAAAEREQAHVDRNIARKLTPAERREKKERKLFDDPNNLESLVSVYKINDLSHPQTRFKVDVNAQENRLTGCAVISDGLSVIAVEGGSKSIKRYGKLMLKRINWAAALPNEDGVEKDEDAPLNKCVLVWQGSVAKPSFNRFLVHQCRTEAAARKVFSDAGVGHYWDLAVNFSDDQI